MNIHVLGDSHSWNYGWPNLHPQALNATVNWLGPITMHRIGRDGLDILDLRNYKINDGDIVLFVFGEIDVRCHIGRIRDERNLELQIMIDDLVQRYFNTLATNKSFYNNLELIVRFVTPPSDQKNNPQFPFYGELIDRAKITTNLNFKLQTNCSRHSFYYLDGYKDFSDQNDCLLPNYSDGHVHLNNNATSLLTQRLLSLINKIYTKKHPVYRKIYFKQNVGILQDRCHSIKNQEYSGVAMDKLLSPDCLTEKATLLNKSGEKLFEKQNFTEAVKVFTKAIETDPNYAPAYNNLGVAYWETGKTKQAISCLKKAIELDFSNTNAIDNLHDILKALGHQSKIKPEGVVPENTGRRLHIGGKEAKTGWEILNAVAGPQVDHLGDAINLSRFKDDTFLEIYASHVLEHFDYKNELTATLKEWKRVLVSRGKIYLSVPDLDTLSELFLNKEQLSFDQRFHVMRMMFGGHVDQYDYHTVGLNFDFLSHFLQEAGFINITRVKEFSIFNDTSSMLFTGVPISLNVIAEKV